MKTILFLLFIACSGYAQTSVQSLVTANTISDLKSRPFSATAVVFVLSKTSIGDNLGATYYWDASDNTTAEDMTNLNVIASTVITAGRWKRLLQRTMTLTNGMLAMNGAKKEYFVTGTTDSNGQITVNLTYENTAGGTAIFSDLKIITAQLATIPSNVNNSTSFYVASSTAKVITLQFFKGNQQVVNVLGTSILPFANVPSGVVENIKFEGF